MSEWMSKPWSGLIKAKREISWQTHKKKKSNKSRDPSQPSNSVWHFTGPEKKTDRI